MRRHHLLLGFLTAIVPVAIAATACGQQPRPAESSSHIRQPAAWTTPIPISASRSPILIAGWRKTFATRRRSPIGWRREQGDFPVLGGGPAAEAIRRRLTDLWNFAQYSAAFKEGGRYYYFKNNGLQNQAVLYVLDALDGRPRPLLDPNTWSKDGTIALGGLGFSDDGRYMAYSRAEAGSDWSTWHVLEIASGKVCPTSFTGPSFPRPPGPRTARASSTAVTRSRRKGPSSRP